MTSLSDDAQRDAILNDPDALDAFVGEQLQAIIADPGVTAKDGRIVLGDDGQPVPNEAVRSRAQRALDELRRSGRAPGA